MNTILKNLRWIGRSKYTGLSTPTDQTATGSTRQRDNAPGSYGRGSYAGHSTYALDFRTQGSYGCSTADLDFSIQGSYGRGSYAGRSTADLDFGTQGSFASGT